MQSKEYRLTDVCDFQGGTQPPKEEWLTKPREGYVRMLQIRDFTQEKAEHVGYVKDTKKLNKCEEDDVLIGRYGASVGKILTGLVGAYNVAIIKTIPDEEILSKRYLYYVLTGADFQNFILNIGARAAQAGFNKSDLSLFKLHIPTSLEDQERIADVLERAQNLIKRRKKGVAELDKFLKMKFLKMFQHFFDKETKPLDSFATITSGLTKGKKYGKLETFFVPYMRVANVQDGYLDLADIKEIEATESEIKRFKLLPGDLLLTEGGDPDKLGRGTIWKGQIDGCIFQNHIFRVRVKGNSINPIFLSFLTGSYYGKAYFLKSSKQTTGIASINSTQLKNFPVIETDIDAQSEFSRLVEHVESLKISFNNSLNDLLNLYDSLSHKALKGKLQIIEKAFAEGIGKIQPKIKGETSVIEKINKELEVFHKKQPHTGAPDEIDNTIRQLEAELTIRGEIPFWDEYVKYRIIKGTFKDAFTFDQLWEEITRFPFETVPKYDEVSSLLFKWLAEENAFIRQQFNESTKQIELIVNETVEA